MTTLKEIKLAINEKIKQSFPNIELQSRDVREGFKRPSFFVHLDSPGRDTRLHYSVREMTVRIYFFPSDRYEYSIEVLEMQEELESIFNLNFAVGDRVLTIDETNSQLVDGVLEFEFFFSYHEDNQKADDSDFMEELIVDV